MTSSIVYWKESSKNSRPWKSQEFMVVFKSWRSVNLSDNITDSVIFSNFSENHRKVRKLSIWLNQQAMEISTFRYGIFSFFRSDYCLSNYAFCYFFRFRVRWLGNRVRKNLPIDSEIMILNFWWSYDLLYIIWKRSFCKTQKYASHENSMIMIEVTVIFRSK